MASLKPSGWCLHLSTFGNWSCKIQKNDTQRRVNTIEWGGRKKGMFGEEEDEIPGIVLFTILWMSLLTEASGFYVRRGNWAAHTRATPQRPIGLTPHNAYRTQLLLWIRQLGALAREPRWSPSSADGGDAGVTFPPIVSQLVPMSAQKETPNVGSPHLPKSPLRPANWTTWSKLGGEDVGHEKRCDNVEPAQEIDDQWYQLEGWDKPNEQLGQQASAVRHETSDEWMMKVEIPIYMQWNQYDRTPGMDQRIYMPIYG